MFVSTVIKKGRVIRGPQGRQCRPLLAVLCMWRIDVIMKYCSWRCSAHISSHSTFDWCVWHFYTIHLHRNLIVFTVPYGLFFLAISFILRQPLRGFIGQQKQSLPAFMKEVVLLTSCTNVCRNRLEMECFNFLHFYWKNKTTKTDQPLISINVTVSKTYIQESTLLV